MPSFASAGAAYEMRPWNGGFEVVVRHGMGGPRRHGALLVCRTRHVHATELRGLPITTPERTLAELWPQVENPSDAGVPAPAINVRIAGEEADLSWATRRLIIEIDGGPYHQDKLEDARKTVRWRGAGRHVERLTADVVYDDPDRLIRAARPGS